MNSVAVRRGAGAHGQAMQKSRIEQGKPEFTIGVDVRDFVITDVNRGLERGRVPQQFLCPQDAHPDGTADVRTADRIWIAARTDGARPTAVRPVPGQLTAHQTAQSDHMVDGGAQSGSGAAGNPAVITRRHM
jgi:hypothetical protein